MMRAETVLRPNSWVARTAARLPERWRARAAAVLPGPHAPAVEPGVETPSVAIIGTGFGGIGMAVRLRQAGMDDVTIFEKADDIGGTWRDNTYPGAACDVPSHLYSLSFAPKADWSRKFPPQDEILAYLNGVVDDFGIRSLVRCGTEVAGATFDEDAQAWDVTLADGTTERFDVLVSATGQLNVPFTPDLPGLDDFEGTTFHSALWDHEHDLTGRDVAVVGIGASAIQFVPAIAERVRSLTLVQRSVNYVAPKPDGEFSERAKTTFARLPLIRRLYRASIWVRFDARWMAFRRGSKLGALGRKRFTEKLGEVVSDELPTEALIPDYPLGCKRILIANDWYPTLFRPNVSVLTGTVERVEPKGLTVDGRTHEVDTIIFGTGFRSTDFLTPMRVVGRGGGDLHEAWRDGAEAHLGITVAGFPNLFMLYGPNTNLGHNSIVFMLERQISYTLSCIRRLVADGARSIEVRPEAQAASNAGLDRALANTVWAEDCHSWYKLDSGRITNNWAGTTARYWWHTAKPRWSDFRFG